jgi:inhibitor of cysteine peptidase
MVTHSHWYKLLLISLLLLLTLPACQTPGTPTLEEGTPTAEPVTIGQANVESVEVQMLETFPVQINLLVKGNLPDGCTELDQINVVFEEASNTFDVDITTQRPADAMCTEALVPFEETIPLDVQGLPAGTYTVDVNGITEVFTLNVDNVLPPSEGDDTPLPSTPVPDQKATLGQANVERIEILKLESFPVQVNVVAMGNLPDGCTEIDEIYQWRDMDTHTLNVEITTRRPADAMCTLALVPFEETIELDVYALPAGTYTVNVNGVADTFTLEQDNILPGEDTPVPTEEITPAGWVPVEIPEAGIGFSVPSDWHALGDAEWGAPNRISIRIGVHWVRTDTDWEPKSMIPRDAEVMLHLTPNVGWGQGDFYHIQRFDTPGYEYHTVVRRANANLAYDFYAIADTLNALEAIEEVHFKFVRSAKLRPIEVTPGEE